MKSVNNVIPTYFKTLIRYAIKYRLLFLFAFSVTFFFVLVSSIVLYNSHQSAIKQARVESKNISYGLDQNLQNSFNKVDLALESISKLITAKDLIRKNHRDEKFKILELYKEKVPEVFAFRIADKNGMVIFNTEKDVPSSFSVLDREYFIYHQINQKSDLFISKPMTSKLNGRPIITLSRRIETETNSFVGIIYAVIALDHFHDLISSIDVGGDGNISLISLDDGAVLYRYPEVNKSLGQKVTLQAEAKNLIRQKIRSGEWEQISTIDHKKKTYAMRLNFTFGYIISTGLAEKDYMRPWFFNFYSAIGLLLVFIVAIGFALIKYILSQEQVEQQKNLMNASARKIAVGRIASGVAHEINNPLAIIKGKSEIARILLGEKQEINYEVISKLLDIEKMVYRVSKIVKGMQILGQKREEEQSVNYLQKIISSALDILSQKMADLNISFVIQDAPTLALNCNRSDMIEVFIHLISNSIDAIKNLEEKWITVSFENDGENVIIKVTDSGKGISKKEVASIMDPFFTTKPPGSGIGLGLSVTEAILRNHGGTLSHNLNSSHTQFVIKIKRDEVKLQASA